MAITVLSSPQDISPGYNPMYLYASSDNTALENFRYLVTITNNSTSTTLANLKIKPRYGDGYLELNIAKILQSNLGSLADDIDINVVTEGFNNTASSGFQYSISIGEEYTYEWAFADTSFVSPFNIGFIGPTLPEFQVNDQIRVTGGAEYFPYSYVGDVGGYAAFYFTTPGAIVGTFGRVTIQQDPNYTYNVYNGTHDVLSYTNDYIQIDLPYQGITPNEPGNAIRNFHYDGLAIVTGITPSGPNYIIETNKPYGYDAGVVPGTITYYDGRLFSASALTTISNKHIFNGADSTKGWLSWDAAEYNSSGTGQSWLTNLPDNWKVSLNDDIFLNNWGNKLSGTNFKAVVKTYDADSVLIGQYEYFNPNIFNAQTEIQNVSMGPRWINDAANSSPSEITVISGPSTPIDCNVSFYTIQVISGISTEQTDLRTFYVDCSCTGRYTNYPILFMDRFGSFVPFDFSLNNKQMVDIKRDNYNKFIGDYSAGSTNGYNYSLADHSNRIYNTELEEKWTLNSNWMSESESLFFEQLITSPLVYILIDDEYRAVNVSNKKYDRKRKNNEKNIRYTLDIDFSNNNNTQIG